MNLFDKKFVYLEWDDVLQGKEVFIADTLPELRRHVENDDGRFRGFVNKNSGDYPCLHNGVYYAFVYYDPNYDCKVAYTHGKQIQSKTKLLSDPWTDCIGEPHWTKACEYRVKPEEPKENECSTCQFQCTAYPCSSCVEHSNYKARVVVHKKRRMTYKELAKWVARGNGQVKDVGSSTITSRGVLYDEGDDNKSCPDRMMIRGWDETEWHMPEIEE